MTQVDVTWLRAFKVFWSFCWRLLICLAAPFFLLSFVIVGAPSQELLHSTWPPPAFSIALGVLGLTVGAFLGTWLVKIVLSKAYSDFRIVLEGPPRRFKIEPRL